MYNTKQGKRQVFWWRENGALFLLKMAEKGTDRWANHAVCDDEV
jgi:hypothetical protein